MSFSGEMSFILHVISLPLSTICIRQSPPLPPAPKICRRTFYITLSSTEGRYLEPAGNAEPNNVEKNIVAENIC
jgi:hypothetical protein